MIIIGEKINGSIPSVAEAIANKDAEFIKDRARNRQKRMQRLLTVVHLFRKNRKLKL